MGRFRRPEYWLSRRLGAPFLNAHQKFDHGRLINRYSKGRLPFAPRKAKIDPQIGTSANVCWKFDLLCESQAKRSQHGQIQYASVKSLLSGNECFNRLLTLGTRLLRNIVGQMSTCNVIHKRDLGREPTVIQPVHDYRPMLSWWWCTHATSRLLVAWQIPNPWDDWHHPRGAHVYNKITSRLLRLMTFTSLSSVNEQNELPFLTYGGYIHAPTI